MERIIEKKAKTLNQYEQLGVSNRVESSFSFSSLEKESSNKLLDYLKKTAYEINNRVTEHQYDSVLNKQANMADINLVTKASGMVASRLGIDPQNSVDLVSQLVKNTMRIEELYGGDTHLILTRLIDEVENTMSQKAYSKAQNAQQEISQMRENMSTPFRSKGVQDAIKLEIMRNMKVSSMHAEQIARSVVNEGKDLLIPLRPYTLQQICAAILHLLVQYNDTTLVFGLHSNQNLILEIKSLLTQGG